MSNPNQQEVEVRSAEAAPAPSDAKESQKREIVIPQMRAHFSPNTINEEDRTVEVVFGSENPTRMRTWEYGLILETLSFDPKHVRLDRLNSGAPLLDNHDAYGSVADIVVGVVERAWTKEKKGHAKVRFGKGEKATKILEMVRDGVLRNISVGYRVNKYEVTRAIEKGELDQYRAIDWEPHEISLVAIPADDSAKVRSLQAVEIKEDPAEIARREEQARQEHEQTLQRRRAEIDILLP